MTPPSLNGADDQINRRFALAQGVSEAARIESERLRRQNYELMERFAKLHTGFTESQRDARRAALNLLEDAEEARRAEQHEATERLRTDAALRASEERHRIALEAAGMGTWDYAIATDQVVWDAQCCRLFGLPGDCQPESVEGSLASIHPDDAGRVRAAMRALATGEVFREEFRILRADGAVRWVSSFGQATQRVEGRPMRASGTIFDVTERHDSEERLAAAQERLRLIVESALEHAIISLDRECRVTTWNPGAERMFGYEAGEMVGQTLETILTPVDRAAGFMAREAQLALAEGRAGGDRWHVRRGGGRVWSNCVMLPMHVRPGGEHVGFVKILRDETASLESRQELERTSLFLREALRDTERARAEAEAAGQAKDHFLAVLSHELRTPLMPIQMALGMLSRRQDLPAPVRAAYEMIKRNVELEAHFIDDLLDVTRISRGKMEIVRVDLDLHEAACRAVEVTTPDLTARKQRLALALDAGEHRLSGDFARLQQAMWNLLKNASKFSPEGGEIGLRTRNEPGDWVVVEITDRGIGMEPEVLGRIFNPFEQADGSITRQFGGLGLGLAIAQGAVLAHGGELLAASEGTGKGATFTLRLPLHASAVAT